MDTFGLYDDLESKSQHTIILKAKFKAIDTNTYGLFMIFLNEDMRMVENLIAVASHYSSIYDMDPSLPWFTLEESLINLKWKGDIAVNITVDLQNFLESSLDRDRGNELYSLIKNNDHMKMESLLIAILMKPLTDRNIELEIVSEIVTREAMSLKRAERNNPQEKKTAAPQIKLSKKAEKAIDVELVLAPVSGIPVYELIRGDKIMVKISDKSVKGRYYIDLLGAKVDGNIIPVPAEVTEIKRNEKNEYFILCMIDKDIYGKAIETEQVKLKKYDELFAQEQSLREFSLDENPEEKRRSFPFFAVITGSLMFVVLLVFIIMWFYNKI